jgi:hypothetical protein
MGDAVTDGWDQAGSLLAGSLRDGGAPWPVVLTAVLCDLRPRFLPKGVIGHSCRAAARNGRVLLCSDRPLADLDGKTARVRIQTWNRSVLPGEAPAPHGVLLVVQVGERRGLSPPVSALTAGNNLAAWPDPVYQTRLTDVAQGADLTLDVGGLKVLEFRRIAPWKLTLTATSAKAPRSTPN